jgi:CRISPR-associated protein (TIGR03984 family)
MNKSICQPLNDCENISSDQQLTDWLQMKAKEHRSSYLLAHATDGVIWGRFQKQSFHLVTSRDAFSQLPELSGKTLQQCRIFGDNAEVMLWRVDSRWKARLIEDKNLPESSYIEEKQMLWGTHAENVNKNLEFTLVTDGRQGLKHAIPLINIGFKNRQQDKKTIYRPIRLLIRHYIDYDDSGIAKIHLSRLVNLESELK